MNQQPSEETLKLVSGLDEFPDWNYLYEQYEHELGYDIGRKRVDDMRRAKAEIYRKNWGKSWWKDTDSGWCDECDFRNLGWRRVMACFQFASKQAHLR